MKIALIGYGKMGKEIEKIARERGNEVSVIIDVDNQKDFDSEAFKNSDVAIEFTVPSIAFQNYQKCFKYSVPVVSGTTGWLDKIEDIKTACQNGQTFFYASNFSIGVNLFFAVNKYLAKLMNGVNGYKVEMEEIHHTQKLDAPSGTAISLAEDIIKEVDGVSAWREEAAENESQIPIKCVREGQVPGNHTIKYESEVDSITINHDAKSRKGFAMGAVLAAEFTAGKKGFLTMQDLLKF